MIALGNGERLRLAHILSFLQMPDSTLARAMKHRIRMNS